MNWSLGDVRSLEFRACRGKAGYGSMRISWEGDLFAGPAPDASPTITAEVTGPGWRDMRVRDVSLTAAQVHGLLGRMAEVGLPRWFHYYRARHQGCAIDWYLELWEENGTDHQWDGFSDGPKGLDKLYQALVALGLPDERDFSFELAWSFNGLRGRQEHWMHLLRYCDRSNERPLDVPAMRGEFLEDVETLVKLDASYLLASGQVATLYEGGDVRIGGVPGKPPIVVGACADSPFANLQTVLDFMATSIECEGEVGDPKGCMALLVCPAYEAACSGSITRVGRDFLEALESGVVSRFLNALAAATQKPRVAVGA